MSQFATKERWPGGRQMHCKGRWFALVVAWLFWLVPAVAVADYPDRPIRLVVPQAPGSATDTVARIVAAELGTQLGQQVIVENKPGAAFTIGLDLVAKAAPDGYTLGLGP